MEIKKAHVELRGRDEIDLEIYLEGDLIVGSKLKGIGCLPLLTRIENLRCELKKVFGQKMSQIQIPEGSGHVELLLQELILRLQDQWNPPYTGLEICHCRVVATNEVERAIISGARSAEAVAKRTSAGTACGNCRPDTDSLIKYRLSSRK